MGLNSLYFVDLFKAGKEEEELVGKRAHELGVLNELGIPALKGFVVTTACQKDFLRFTKIDKEIAETIALTHPSLAGSIDKIFHPIRREIINHEISDQTISEFHKFYRKLAGVVREKQLSVSSSAFDNKSIAYSPVSGDANLVLKIKSIWSTYLNNPVAVIVQEYVRPKIKGRIVTDNQVLDKKLTEEQRKKLNDYYKIIQTGYYLPKEIEYIVKDNEIFITDVIPFTGAENRPQKPTQSVPSRKIIAKGLSVNPGMAVGPVRIYLDTKKDIGIKNGDVIIAKSLDSLSLVGLKKAKAVILDSVLPSSLNKTLYRKSFHIPTVEGVTDATTIFHNGNVVTVNGENGEIYSGGIL